MILRCASFCRRTKPSRRIVGPVVFAWLAIVLISASPNAKPDDLIREGDQAIEKAEYEKALELYQEAEERGTDPGLIAFNKAAAYWHLNDFRKAELHYRMTLNDAAASTERRARSFFNLGNCLVKQAGERDIALLREAIRYYEYCLDLAADGELRALARHNLEVAKLLWIDARSQIANPPAPNADEPPDTPRQPEAKKKSEPEKKKEPGKTDVGKNIKKELDSKAKIDKGTESSDPKQDPNRSDSPQAGPGRVPVIPDKDELERRSESDTLAALMETEIRLKIIRQRLRAFATIPEKPSGKDW